MALWPPQPHIKLVQVFFPEGTAGRGVVNLTTPQFSVKVKNEWRYTSTPLICPHGMYEESCTFLLPP